MQDVTFVDPMMLRYWWSQSYYMLVLHTIFMRASLLLVWFVKLPGDHSKSNVTKSDVAAYMYMLCFVCSQMEHSI